ncbi:arsenicals resistance [Rhodotorula toruloides]
MDRTPAAQTSQPPPDTMHTHMPHDEHAAAHPHLDSMVDRAAHPPQHTPPLQLKRLKLLDQLLALWILLAMALGIILGALVPSTSVVLEKVQFVGVSLPIAIALIVMMWPILCRVSPGSLIPLFRQRQLWQHLAFSVVVNWIVSPLLMLGLAWAFLPDKEDLREGLIVVGVARCIAMVLVWTDIAGGDLDYCAILVAFNSILQMVLFSPVSILFLRVFRTQPLGDVEAASVSYSTVAKSVAVFLGIPLAAAVLTRSFFFAIRRQKFFQERFLPAIAPLSLISLLFTTIIIFAAQGKQVVHSITDVLRVIPPLIIYFFTTFAAVVFLLRQFHVPYPRTATQAFTASSNNFELAQAVCIATYGAQSPQALAATVGPLVEVPVLLSLAYLLVHLRRRWRWDTDDECPTTFYCHGKNCTPKSNESIEAKAAVKEEQV